ncbi:MAG: NAD-dependent epimerase/dehydratase family protein [Raineya sp.]
MAKKVFITGATGYVGEQLARKLANQGYITHLLVRRKQKAQQIFKDDAHFKIFEGDILEKEKVRQAMKDCQEVYHLAAYAKVWDKDPNAFVKMNIEGTKNVLDNCLSQKIEKVVITSTAGVLGPSVDGKMVDENTQSAIPYSTEYERTKAIAEEEAKKYLEKGLAIVTLNPTRIYGAGQRSESNAVTMLLEKYWQGKWRIMPGDGKRVGNYAYINDVVEGHLAAMQKGRTGERYILGGENVSYQELFDLFGEVTQKKLTLFKMPIAFMMSFAHLQMLKTQLTGKPPLITPNFVRKYLYDWKVSTQKAENELGLKITPLKIGLEKTLEWLKQEKK